MDVLATALAAELTAMAEGSDTNVESVNVHFIDRVLRRIPKEEQPPEVTAAFEKARSRFVPALAAK